MPPVYAEKITNSPPRRCRRPRDPELTAFEDTYKWALGDLANLYALPEDDPDVTRAAWHLAMAEHPVPPHSAHVRCHRDGLPLPPRGRPPASAADLPPLPPVACRRSGLALFDGAWVAREGQHLSRRTLSIADPVHRQAAARRQGAQVWERIRNRRRVFAWRKALATAQPSIREHMLTRLHQLASNAHA